jgi:predicted ABC-type ATPase
LARFYVDENGNISKKKKSPYSVGYGGDITFNEEEDIAPVRSDRGKSDLFGLDLVQSGAFDDGYQFGDVIGSIFGTAGDLGLEVVKGAGSLVEGVGDLIGYGGATVADWLGADDFADDWRGFLKRNTVNDITKGADDFLEKYSFAGDTLDAVGQGVGQVGTLILTGGMASTGAGATALTTGLMGASGVGSGMSEAYEAGATDEEALKYGLISGAADAVTEMLFGGMGKGMNALGFGRGLSSADDMLAKTVSNKFKSQIGKNLAEFGIKAGAEGLEEVLAGATQAWGKSITYMQAEDGENYWDNLGKILKDENLLEQFVVGGLTSGIAQAGSVNTSIKTGRDFITGLTQNEQTVVDSLYESEIAGKDLSKKEKQKIHDQILSKLDKGYISIGDIESALGGETYNTYKETFDSETALKNKLTAYKKEYNELKSIHWREKTEEQFDRMAELETEIKNLEAQVKETTANSKLKEMKSQLSKNVFELTKNDTKLQESYREEMRRGQDLELDVEKYKGAAKITAQNLLKGGMNNTNRVHDVADLLTRIAADRNIVFDVATAKKLAEAGLAVDGKQVNGVITKDGIVLNLESSAVLETTVGHEITHALEGTEHYEVLKEAIREYAELKGVYADKYSSLESIYAKKDAKGNILKDANGNTVWIRDDVDIDSEIIADLVGEYLFTDADFINNLSVKHRNVFQKIYDEIKYLLKIATAGSEEARKLEEVKRAFDKAYKENKASAKATAETDAKSDADVKHSLSESKTLYTGSPVTDIQQFKVGGANGAKQTGDRYGRGIYLTTNKTTAKGYAGDSGRVYEINADDLNIFDLNNPITEEMKATLSRELNGKDKQFRNSVLRNFRTEKTFTDFESAEQFFDEQRKVWKDEDGYYSANKPEIKSADDKTGIAVIEYTDFVNIDNAIGSLTGNQLYDALKSISTDDFASFITGHGFDGIAFDEDTDNQQYVIYRNEDRLNILPDSKAKYSLSADTATYDDNGNVIPLSQRFNTESDDIRFSLSEDSKGNKLSPAVQNRFAKSKVVDENGNLKVVYHGTASGEFFIFDKAKGSVEGDFGSGFYFTDNADDVSRNYEGGGPDFENKIDRRAEQIEAEEDISYAVARKRAIAELYKGSHKFEVYLNIENPAIVGETTLFDPDTYFGQYNEEDYDSYEDYEGDVEQLIADDIDQILWDVERNVDVYSTDGLAEVLWNAVNEGGIGIEDLKKQINELYLEDSNGNFVGNEVARQIIESLGYDGIIDPTVSGKWNMDMEEGTTHYIVFKPNQIKSISNENPTDNPDIRYSLSDSKTIVNKLTGEEISKNTYTVLSKLERGEAVPISELEALKEVQEGKLKAVGFRDEFIAQHPQLKVFPAEDVGTHLIDTPEREKLRNDILQKRLSQGSFTGIDKNGDEVYNGSVEKGKRLDIVIGLPASGKSSAIVNPLSEFYKAIVIDSDIIKKELPEYNDGWGASLVHEESSKINLTLFDEATNIGDNIVLPIVGAKTSSVEKYMAVAKERGYEVHLHLNELPGSKAMGRMLGRYFSTGRFIDPAIAAKYGDKPTEVYETMKGRDGISGYSRWNNDVARGQRPTHTEISGGNEIYGAYSDSWRAVRGANVGRDDIQNTQRTNANLGDGVEGSRVGLESDVARRIYSLGSTGNSEVVRLTTKTEEALTKSGVVRFEIIDSSNDSNAFSVALASAREADATNGWAVTPKSAEELVEYNIRTIMSADGKAGLGIAPDGDIEAVFKNRNGGPAKALDTLIPAALEAGGNKLDCYGTGLVRVYSQYGFVPVARVTFVAEYANEGWTEEKGTPDIFFMVHNGDSADTVIANKGKYKQYTLEELNALPLFEGETAYDDAYAYRDGKLPQIYSLSDPNDIAPVDFQKSAKYLMVDKSITQDLGDIAPTQKRTDAPVATDDEEIKAEKLVDKDSFVVRRAKELYEEITNLKKGVRASKSLGYLLDHGHEWRSIKTALLNIRDNPNQVVNENSAAESVAREMLGREYDEMVYELNEQTDVAESVRIKMKNIQTEIDNNEKLREQANADYDAEIAEVQAKYDAKKNKNTIEANNLLRRIERLNRMKNTNDANYAKRIGDLEARLEKMSQPTYKTAVQRRKKQSEYTALMESLVGDTSTWVDKKLGISYKVNTLRRNLRDIVRDANGNPDIAKADAITDELEGNYDRNEAEKKRQENRYKSPVAELKLTDAEYVYSHMLGEFRHNPDSKLTEETVKEYYEQHKKDIDTAKVDKAIEETRKIFDNLFERLNARLREQGMKEIPYRKGYFPHFTNPKQGLLAKLFNWKPVDHEIPTSIAGLTENFNPERSWQSFNKERKSDITDYNLAQALDTYVHGALDWIYHIEDIQKRRALENYIRYTHSEEGVKARIDAIRNSEELDADEMQDQIDLVYAEANNPLNNFVTDLRAGTNTLAAKKSSMDRALEEKTNRKIYSVMTNLNNRVSANMVVGSVSSALTNFIPIVQSWVEVSPMYSLRGMGDTIRSTARDDGIINKSTFLTNRLIEEEKLYKTGWDKASDKAAFLMNAIDSFTSQTVWRSKYLQNISEGMSETEAIHNADQFAKNVIAGRSRGNMPTIFDAKNPITKIFTAFQLEVANQYGYMFKDAPTDSKNKARLVKGFATMFIGSYLYNALYSSLVGRNAAFDPLSIIEDLLGDLEDEEEEEAIVNLANNVIEEIPFVGGLLGGGRIPISSALPYSGEYEGFSKLVTDISEENWENVGREMLSPLYYLIMPFGGGQIKKTNEGLGMFSEDHPIAGSYTASGNLRFPVEDNFINRMQAALFGQYASKNARDYFDNNRTALKEKQIQEFIDVDIPIRDYWEYREGLSEQKTIEDKFDYIAGLDLPVSKKNILINNIVDREEAVDLEGYEDFSSYEEFDFATKNPEKYTVAKAVGGYNSYSTHYKAMNDISADKDENGKSIVGSRKEKIIDYVNGLDIDYGMKIILFKSEYKADDTYNYDILDYLNSRDDLTYEEIVTILTELDFTVDAQGNVYWD